MKNTLKKVARHLIPAPILTRVASVRSRNFQRRFLEERGLLAITRQIIERHGTKVLHGPFRGLDYPADSLTSRNGTPKLLGSYEKELHPALDEFIARAAQYHHIADIGCAEGYYAVGLALKTGVPVHAFDTEPRELAFCREMAALNQVTEKIIFRGWCDPDYLGNLHNERCLIISDCEGYEEHLFTEQAIEGLGKSDLIIELHDINRAPTQPNMFDVLRQRFEQTHDTKLVRAAPRQSSDYSELDFLGADAQKSIEEYRVNGQMWMVLTPKS